MTTLCKPPNPLKLFKFVIPPLRYISFYPKRFCRAYKYLPLTSKLWAIAFVAYLTFHVIYCTTLSAHAWLLNDFTAPGRTVGNLVMDFFSNKVDQIYTGQYGIIPWMCTSANNLAIFPLAIGVMERMEAYSSGHPGEYAVKDYTFWMLLAFCVSMAGGGVIYGQMYMVIFHTLENITQRMDDFLNIRDAIDSGKSYLAVNSMVSAKITTCQSMTGQEQQRCLNDATQLALQEMGGYREVVQGQKWFGELKDALINVGKTIVNPDFSWSGLGKKGQAIFYLFSSPVQEVKAAANSLNTITTLSAYYGAAVVLSGLAGPWAWLASILTPLKQSALIAWICQIFSLWLWRATVLILLWMSSEMVTEAASSPGDALPTQIFADVIEKGSVGLAIACSAAGFAVFSGISAVGSQTAQDWGMGGITSPNFQNQTTNVTQPASGQPNSAGVETDY
jgi:hypothetical protein